MQPKPDAEMCARFMRAHSAYLMTSKVEWPYVNSAAAIASINDAAADMLEGSGAVTQAVRLSLIKSALLGIVGRWEKNGGIIEEEFIDRARAALSR